MWYFGCRVVALIRVIDMLSECGPFLPFHPHYSFFFSDCGLLPVCGPLFITHFPPFLFFSSLWSFLLLHTTPCPLRHSPRKVTFFTKSDLSGRLRIVLGVIGMVPKRHQIRPHGASMESPLNVVFRDVVKESLTRRCDVSVYVWEHLVERWRCWKVIWLVKTVICPG